MKSKKILKTVQMVVLCLAVVMSSVLFAGCGDKDKKDTDNKSEVKTEQKTEQNSDLEAFAIKGAKAYLELDAKTLVPMLTQAEKDAITEKKNATDDEVIAILNAMLGEGSGINIKDIKVKNVKKLDLAEYVSDYNETYGEGYADGMTEVADVTLSVTAKVEGETVTEEGTAQCAKIKGKWHIVYFG